MSRRIAPWMLALLAIFALLAVVRLFQMRFATGDIYPAYSSLRSDPLGTKGLYESLESLHSLELKRHFRSVHQLPAGRGTTLLILGLPAQELNGTEDEIDQLETFMRLGGRLVISLNSESLGRSSWTGGTNGVSSRPAKPRAAQWTLPVELSSRWQFHLTEEALKREGGKSVPVEVVAFDPGRKPERMEWHSPGVFTAPEDPWHAVFLRGTNAVVMERSWGAGTLVLATDSFPLSNEALRRSRSTPWLAWVVGSSGRVVFDETHLGVREQAGFASLAREYRLHLFGACLVVLAALFMWQGATSFALPIEETGERAEWVTGRDAADGCVSLLRRNVLPSEVLKLSVQEWIRSQHSGRSLPPEKLAAVQAVLDRENLKPAAQRNPVLVYRDIARIVALPGRAAETKEASEIS